jgi:hypothetical protein
MSEVTQCAYNVLDFGQCSIILFVYFGNLQLEALTGFFDAGMDGRKRMRFLAHRMRELGPWLAW